MRPPRERSGVHAIFSRKGDEDGSTREEGGRGRESCERKQNCSQVSHTLKNIDVPLPQEASPDYRILRLRKEEFVEARGLSLFFKSK